MVLFILCIAVLNMGLGYGLACYLHGQGGPLAWGSGRKFLFGLKFLSFVKDPEEDLDDAMPASAVREKVAASAAETPMPAAIDDANSSFDRELTETR